MKRRFKSSATDDRFDGIKAKKVTSPDSAEDPLSNVGRVALTKKYQTARNTRSDTPKTSEYAFFKKLKKDIGHCNSDLLQKGSKLSKNTKSSNCITASTYDVLKGPNKDLKIPIQEEKEYQTNECQSFSTVGDVVGISKEAKLMSFPLPTAATPVDSNAGISKEAKLKCFSLPTAVTPVESNLQLSPLVGSSNNSGSKYSGSGIFAFKRQKLRRLASTLFPDVGKLNSERFDLVSALLSRLFPGRKEDENFWDSQVRQGDSDASTSSLAYSKPDHAMTRPNSRHREVTVPEYRMSQSDGFPNNFFGVTKGRVPLEWDNFNSAFHLIDYDSEPGFHYEDADNGQISNNKIIKSPWQQSDSLPSLFLDRHELADDILHSENIPVSTEEQHLSLDWDCNGETTDPALAITTIGGNELCSPIATSRHIDYQWSTEKNLDVLEFCSSSLFKNAAYLDAVPYIHSTSFLPKLFPANFCTREFGTILEHEEYAIARMDQFGLPLLCNSEDLISLDVCIPENAFESGNEIISYLSHSEKNHCDSDSDALLPMALDTFSWKFSSATNLPLQQELSSYHALTLPHREDEISLPQEEIKNCWYSLYPIETAPPPFEQVFNSHLRCSCNPEVSCEETGGGSLLLDNSSWLTPVEEISPDHSDEWTWS